MSPRVNTTNQTHHISNNSPKGHSNRLTSMEAHNHAQPALVRKPIQQHIKLNQLNNPVLNSPDEEQQQKQRLWN